jgi:hypothetical protein
MKWVLFWVVILTDALASFAVVHDHPEYHNYWYSCPGSGFAAELSMLIHSDPAPDGGWVRVSISKEPQMQCVLVRKGHNDMFWPKGKNTEDYEAYTEDLQQAEVFRVTVESGHLDVDQRLPQGGDWDLRPVKLSIE